MILQIKAIILILLAHKHQVGIGEIRQVCNFAPLWRAHTALPAHVTASQQTCEAAVQGEAPMWGPDPSPEKSAQARTVNSRLGTQQSDHKTRGEIAAWFSRSQPAHCVQFLPLLHPPFFRKKLNSMEPHLHPYPAWHCWPLSSLKSWGPFSPPRFQNNVPEIACWVYACHKCTELRLSIQLLKKKAKHNFQDFILA